MAEKYQYKPLRFYVTCFAATWVFWIAAAFISGSENDNGLSLLFEKYGLSNIENKFPFLQKRNFCMSASNPII